MQLLPLEINSETIPVLKKLVSVRSALAGLNGIAESTNNNYHKEYKRINGQP
jgi:hypothetical protein